MKFDKLKPILDEKRAKPTLLGVGPMSKLCVDAIIELANFVHVPIQIIASRRQIECAELGKGYVNNWTTEEFAKYVRAKDTGGWIILARDHGGPWQGDGEADLPHAKAMACAKASYKADITSGFDVIHIDPSLRDRSLKSIFKDIATLLKYCESVEGDVVYECGTEETNGKTSDLESFNELLHFCAAHEKIKFVVGQTGTHVKETRNVGTFDAGQARALSELCHEKNLLLKEHNLDYASKEVLDSHKHCKIDAANVAPEFGVIETKRLLTALKKQNMTDAMRHFQKLVVDSGKWEKWVLSADVPDEQKTVIAGHYLFAHPDVETIYADLNKQIYFDDVVKNDIKGAILNYLRPFGWVY